ncbi:MAG: hypothetical protein RIE24_02540 [Silicimonas sp.]
MARSLEPIFLERQNYRRRRLGDAAKFLPFLGLVLFLLPVLWAEKATTAGGIVYLFTVWAFLICVVAILSRFLSDAEPEKGDAAAAPRTER